MSRVATRPRPAPVAGVPDSEPKRRRPIRRRSDYGLVILAAPAVILLLIFAYGPMAGLVVAFQDFNVADGIFSSPWAGFENFEFFFTSGHAARILRNTLLLNVLFLAATLGAGILLALMLNEIRGRVTKRFFQSVIFVPYFVSPIVVSIFLHAFLAGPGGRGGLVNDMLSIVGIPNVMWYTEPGPWPWILTLVKIWQLGGYMSVIFLAAITAIPDEVYEAGVIDGASRAQMALRITTPLLKPTAAILLVLGVGRIFYGDFATIYAIVGDNGTLFPTTDVIDTYVFRALRTRGDFGTTAAIGLFQSVVGFLLVVVATTVQRRYAKETAIL